MQKNKLKPGHQEIKINMNTAIIDYGMGNLTSVNNSMKSFAIFKANYKYFSILFHILVYV